jgi:hypothetical protein
VFGASQGGYATHIVCTEERLKGVPEGWSFADAAGVFVTAPTSYAGLVVRAGIKKGMFCLLAHELLHTNTSFEQATGFSFTPQLEASVWPLFRLQRPLAQLLLRLLEHNISWMSHGHLAQTTLSTIVSQIGPSKLRS